MPARVRGWTDLVINGSFWVGAAMGAGATIVLLDPAVLGGDLGWRAAFLIGAALSAVIFFMRLWIPESPRWLVDPWARARGRGDHRRYRGQVRVAGPRARAGSVSQDPPARTHAHAAVGGRRHAVSHAALSARFVGLSLMMAQAFFYNAIFFTYALVLTEFYAVPAASVGWYILPFAAGNFLGPVLLGRLFDTIGRRPDARRHLCALGHPAGARPAISSRTTICRPARSRPRG